MSLTFLLALTFSCRSCSTCHVQQTTCLSPSVFHQLSQLFDVARAADHVPLTFRVPPVVAAVPRGTCSRPRAPHLPYSTSCRSCSTCHVQQTTCHSPSVFHQLSQLFHVARAADHVPLTFRIPPVVAAVPRAMCSRPRATHLPCSTSCRSCSRAGCR